MRYAAALAALLLTLVSCSSDEEGPDRATDPADAAPTAVPTDVPTPVIVMDVDGPELCLGPVAESYPPQCGGPPVRGWSWADHEGDYDQVGQVRWGEFVVDGYYEGDEFVVTDAEPALPPR